MKNNYELKTASKMPNGKSQQRNWIGCKNNIKNFPGVYRINRKYLAR